MRPEHPSTYQPTTDERRFLSTLGLILATCAAITALTIALGVLADLIGSGHL